jgi:RimJ/RimL family protein N-acetyltransferase
MNNIFLESKDLILEPLENKHLSFKYTTWLNDKNTTKFNSHGIFPNTIEKTKQYINDIQSSKSEIVLAIIEKISSNHIGNISISSIDYINSNADIGILIGDKTTHGKGYATQAFKEVISHCFNKLNLHKITAGTSADNIAMQKVIEKLSMSKDGVLRDAIKRDNEYIDIYIYSLLNS